LNLLVFIEGKLLFAGQEDVKVIAVFCDKFVQECCDYILSSTDADVAIAVLVDKQRIVVRRHPNNTTLDVSAFTQRIASGGGTCSCSRRFFDRRFHGLYEVVETILGPD